MEMYENFKELQMNGGMLAKELLDACGTGEWHNEKIYCYDDLEELAEYELYEGWYTGWFNDIEKYSRSYFNGAPNPFEFIDLKGLGLALSRSWDESVYYLASTGEVLSTSYGW